MNDSNSASRKRQAPVASWELEDEGDTGALAGLPIVRGLSAVLVTPNYQQARMLEMRLEVCGIPCVIRSSAETGVFGDAEGQLGQTSVLVPDHLVGDANRVLRQEMILN